MLPAVTVFFKRLTHEDLTNIAEQLPYTLKAAACRDDFA